MDVVEKGIGRQSQLDMCVELLFLGRPLSSSKLAWTELMVMCAAQLRLEWGNQYLSMSEEVIYRALEYCLMFVVI